MAVFEGKKDFSKEVERAVQESLGVNKEKGLDEAVAYLLPLEKKCRVNNDFNSLKELSTHMVRLCINEKNWDKLNAVLILINKRSSQFKSTLSAVVKEVLDILNAIAPEDSKISVIKALKEVCDGKIYLESESARLSFVLAKIYEDRKDINSACDTIQDVHVETYGSLTKLEKAEYILEQIRLNLLKKDYIRTAIHSRKMNLKTIEELGFENIKLRYYFMQIEYFTHEKNTWEICQAYFKIANTKLSDNFTNSDLQIAIESCIIYLLLSKHDNHQHDLLHRMKLLLTTQWKEAQINPVVSNMLRLFSLNEIVKMPFNGQAVIENHISLSKFAFVDPDVVKAFIDLITKRAMEHNLRIVAKYYDRIAMPRLQQLLGLSQDSLEEYLSDMSFNGDLTLKIDRPSKIVTFHVAKTSEEVLSKWSEDITQMLQLMESTTHLINRENMVHKV